MKDDDEIEGLDDWKARQKRDPGKISSIQYGKDPDRGFLTVCVMWEGPGSGQGFGLGTYKNEEDMWDYLHCLCAAFGVKRPEDLKGEKCFALRSFGFLNDSIVALESMKTGKRFNHNKWYRERYPKTCSATPLEARKEELESRIQNAYRQIADAQRQLAEVDAEYTDWER